MQISTESCFICIKFSRHFSNVTSQKVIYFFDVTFFFHATIRGNYLPHVFKTTENVSNHKLSFFPYSDFCHPTFVTPVFVTADFCHPTFVTRLLSPDFCHPIFVTRLLSHLLLSSPTFVTRLMSPDFCHPIFVTRLLSPGLLSHQSNHSDLWWIWRKSKSD